MSVATEDWATLVTGLGQLIGCGVVQLVTSSLRLPRPDTLNEPAEISWPLTAVPGKAFFTDDSGRGMDHRGFDASTQKIQNNHFGTCGM